MVQLLRTSLAGVVLSLVIPASAATAQTAQNTVTLPDGRKLAMTCAGEGGPTIVLDGGTGVPLEAWSKTMPELGKIARTCAYNRAGYAGSDPGPMPRDAAHIVDDMKAMLTAARLPPPYVLVGQSAGGRQVRLFGERYPGDVAALVLVDPTVDDEARLRAIAPSEDKTWLAVEESVRLCVAAKARGEAWSVDDPAYSQCGAPPKMPVPQPEIAMAQAVKSEFDSRPVGDAQVRESYKGPLPFPIVVLTADGSTRNIGAPSNERAATQAVIVELHQKIAATSQRGEQRTVPGGTHMMQWDKPEVVIAAIREVVTRYRGGR